MIVSKLLQSVGRSYDDDGLSKWIDIYNQILIMDRYITRTVCAIMLKSISIFLINPSTVMRGGGDHWRITWPPVLYMYLREPGCSFSAMQKKNSQHVIIFVAILKYWNTVVYRFRPGSHHDTQEYWPLHELYVLQICIICVKYFYFCSLSEFQVRFTIIYYIYSNIIISTFLCLLRFQACNIHQQICINHCVWNYIFIYFRTQVYFRYSAIHS